MKYLTHLYLYVLLVSALLLGACGGDDKVEAVNINATDNTDGNATISQSNATAEETVSAQKHKVFGVGLIYVSPIESSGWTYEHEKGRLALDELDGVVTSYVENEPVGPDAERAMQSMAAAGYQLIIATSYGYKQALVKVSQEYPDVKFLYCSGDATSANVSTYFGRMYQARYLTGMVAGAMTKTNSIGYVAAFPLPEVIRGINAFALGVREVNPTAEVRVVWTNQWYSPDEERNAAEFLVNTASADVLTQHTDNPTVQEVAEQSGVYSIGYNSDMSQFAPQAHLAAAVWNWTPFYLDIVKKLQAGQWEEFDYWKGLESGIVDISPYGQAVPLEVQERVNSRKEEIIEGRYTVFSGPVFDAEGQVRIGEGQIPTDVELRSMDWFVDGVVVMADAQAEENSDATSAPN